MKISSVDAWSAYMLYTYNIVIACKNGTELEVQVQECSDRMDLFWVKLKSLTDMNEPDSIRISDS